MALSIPVERITEDARRVDLTRAVLWLLAAIPFLIGWVAGKTVLAVAWLWSAGVAGWQEARRPANEPSAAVRR